MPGKKLTDSEIKKALKCCADDSNNTDKICKECPYYKIYSSHCINYLCGDTLDLINRLQAENERLLNLVTNQSLMIAEQDKKIKRLKKVQMQLDDLCKMHNIIKSEAYNEFANWQEVKLANNPNISTVALQSIIKTNDNLLKELVGEDK